MKKFQQVFVEPKGPKVAKQIKLANRDMFLDPDPFSSFWVIDKSGCYYVTGWLTEAKEYVKKRWPDSFHKFAYYGPDRMKSPAGTLGWRHLRNNIYVLGPQPKMKHYSRPDEPAIRHFRVVNYETQLALYLRRFPQYWIPEFDLILDNSLELSAGVPSNIKVFRG